MPKSYGQKLKILYIMKIFLELSDEDHPVTISEIISGLESYGIYSERKSIYDDIAALCDFGLDIEKVKAGKFGYYVASRNFELPELKLLVDAVQSSKFITYKKSLELINKIEKLTSVHQAHALSRQVYVANRIKTMNESIYYTIDFIHTAISESVKISFNYFDWNINKEKVLRHGGKTYVVSPFALCWDNENYYMIAFDSDTKTVRHYRVDKILNIKILEELCEELGFLKNFDAASYSKKIFGMFGGEEEFVTLLCDEDLAGVIIDRFGKDVIFLKRENRVEVSVKVAVSPQFFSWIFGFSGKIEIAAPKHVKDKFCKQIEIVLKNYKIHQNFTEKN